jgi:phosphopantetheinyl transferase
MIVSKFCTIFGLMQKARNINLNGVSIYLLVIDPEQESKYLETLTFNEKTRLDSIKHPTKKLEFAASRFLKHKLFGSQEIKYLEHGTPVLEQIDPSLKLHISITHSRNYTAIAQHKDFPIAVDLEWIDDKSVRLAPKFCNENEASIFDMASKEEMTLLWSFKETLYKLSDRNGLIFKEDIRVSKKNGSYQGKVRLQSGFLKVDLSFEKVNGFYLTCNHTYMLDYEDS